MPNLQYYFQFGLFEYWIISRSLFTIMTCCFIPVRSLNPLMHTFALNTNFEDKMLICCLCNLQISIASL